SRLLAAVREVLGEALAVGGTSFDSLYVDVNGESGYFERELAVYGREGKPCPRCGTPVRRDPFMNRSAYSCPRCQPPHPVPDGNRGDPADLAYPGTAGRRARRVSSQNEHNRHITAARLDQQTSG